MRPGQSNKRVRGRSRRGPSPLSRSYESNGPDVKIRGTASHIAEKYMQLARDSQSSGDPVAAENYFQHAEHYLRIIAAAQQAQQQNPNDQRQRYNGSDESDGEGASHGNQPQGNQSHGSQSQPDTHPDTQQAEAPRGDGPQPHYNPQANGEPQPTIDRDHDRDKGDSRKRAAPGDSGSRDSGAAVNGKSDEPAKAAPADAGETGDAAAANAAPPVKRRRRRPATSTKPSADDATPAADTAEPATAASGANGHEVQGEAAVEASSDDAPAKKSEDNLVAAGDS